MAEQSVATVAGVQMGAGPASMSPLLEPELPPLLVVPELPLLVPPEPPEDELETPLVPLEPPLDVPCQPEDDAPPDVPPDD